MSGRGHRSWLPTTGRPLPTQGLFRMGFATLPKARRRRLATPGRWRASAQRRALGPGARKFTGILALMRVRAVSLAQSVLQRRSMDKPTYIVFQTSSNRTGGEDVKADFAELTAAGDLAFFDVVDGQKVLAKAYAAGTWKHVQIATNA